MNSPSMLVQKWVNLRPNYYMKYYAPLPANRRLPGPSVDRPTNASGHAYKKTRAGPSHSPRF